MFHSLSLSLSHTHTHTLRSAWVFWVTAVLVHRILKIENPTSEKAVLFSCWAIKHNWILCHIPLCRKVLLLLLYFNRAFRPAELNSLKKSRPEWNRVLHPVVLIVVAFLLLYLLLISSVSSTMFLFFFSSRQTPTHSIHPLMYIFQHVTQHAPLRTHWFFDYKTFWRSNRLACGGLI